MQSQEQHVVLAHPATPTGSQNPQWQVRRLRRKVMCLSASSAALLCIGGLFGYAFNLQNDLSLLQFLKDQGIIDGDEGGRVGPRHHHHGPNRFALFFFAGLPFLVLGLLVSLCVPGCGYWGAKHLNSKLLGCFWGCSICSAVWGLVGLMVLGWFMVAGVPMAEHWIQVCDVAEVCCGVRNQFCGPDQTSPLPEFEEQFLDCVMSAHPRYESKFPHDGGHPRLLTGQCMAAAKIATKCDPREGDWHGDEDGPGLTDEELDAELHRFHHRFPSKRQWWGNDVENADDFELHEPFHRYLQSQLQSQFSKRGPLEDVTKEAATGGIAVNPIEVRRDIHKLERNTPKPWGRPWRRNFEGKPHKPHHHEDAGSGFEHLRGEKDAQKDGLSDALERLFGSIPGSVQDNIDAGDAVSVVEQIPEAVPADVEMPPTLAEFRGIGDMLMKNKDDPRFHSAVRNKMDQGFTADDADKVGHWFGKGHRHGGHHGRGHPDPEWLATCKLNPKAVGVMHAIATNLPQLVQEIEFVMLVKFLLSVPGILLSFVASYFGFKLWCRARKGYRYVTAAGNLSAGDLAQPMVDVPQYPVAGDDQSTAVYHASYVPAGAVPLYSVPAGLALPHVPAGYVPAGPSLLTGLPGQQSHPAAMANQNLPTGTSATTSSAGDQGQDVPLQPSVSGAGNPVQMA